MGYYYTMHDAQQFFISASRMADVKKVLAALVERKGYRTWSGSEPLEEPFRSVRDETSWSFRFDDSGNIVKAVFSGEHKDYYREVFEAIAPYVQPGSFIEIAGEDDDDIFRLVFDGTRCEKVMATVSF